MIVAVVVGLAGSVGAVGRFALDDAVTDRWPTTFPLGTLLVNCSGSLVLGVVTGLAWYHGLGGRAHAVIGTGFCGAFTTWSSVTWETVRLLEDGERRRAVVAVVGGVAAALAAAALAIVVVAVL
ncbi:MAG: fluoride efflux transporter FluC [Acidimicrobiales bacterium]